MSHQQAAAAADSAVNTAATMKTISRVEAKLVTVLVKSITAGATAAVPEVPVPRAFMPDRGQKTLDDHKEAPYDHRHIQDATGSDKGRGDKCPSTPLHRKRGKFPQKPLTGGCLRTATREEAIRRG